LLEQQFALWLGSSELSDRSMAFRPLVGIAHWLDDLDAESAGTFVHPVTIPARPLRFRFRDDAE
jgi:hypothetical protein